MCGIFAYTGPRPALPILRRGLARLEYRGYDSAGFAVSDSGGLSVWKEIGRVSAVSASVPDGVPGSTGVAHTRWATHGGVRRANAHPHLDGEERIAVVHNGIIDNATALRARLEADGVVFRSDTDTEVLPHLIARAYAGDPVRAVQRALDEVEGTWGIAVTFADHPGCIVAARNGSPIVVGLGDGEMFVASDAHALSPWVDRVVYLEDGDVCLVSGKLLSTRRDGGVGALAVHTLAAEADDGGLGDFPHYMLKEIHEQPEVIRRATSGRIADGGARLGCFIDRPHLAEAGAVTLLACGTSALASAVGAGLIEALARVPARAELASEFAHRDPIVRRGDLYVAVSQSGETYDTLSGLELAMARGGQGLGVVNVVGSSIARRAGAGVHLHAGPEISVASTKAFTAQVAVLALIADALAARRPEAADTRRDLRAALAGVPAAMEAVLAGPAHPIEAASAWIDEHDYALFMGRGLSWHVAAEGALKLKEIAYVPCDAYAAGEMKHGPIAMLRPGTPVVAVAPRDRHREAVLSNIAEARARGARIILVHTEGDERAAAMADLSLPVPDCHPLLTPLLTVLPLQRLAYACALRRGCDVDMPRNLAKSVTVA